MNFIIQTQPAHQLRMRRASEFYQFHQHNAPPELRYSPVRTDRRIWCSNVAKLLVVDQIFSPEKQLPENSHSYKKLLHLIYLLDPDIHRMIRGGYNRANSFLPKHSKAHISYKKPWSNEENRQQWTPVARNVHLLLASGESFVLGRQLVLYLSKKFISLLLGTDRSMQPWCWPHCVSRPGQTP